MTHEDIVFYTKLGICPRCHKHMLYGDEKACPECRAKQTNYKALTRESNREEYNLYMRVYQKQAYEERKKNHICTICGKRKSENGYFTCDVCRLKRLNRRREKNYKESRYERGICRFCDTPIEQGYKVCEYHHKMNIDKGNNEKSKKAREKNKNIILK